MLVTTSADRWVAPLIVREDGNIAALLQDTMHPQWVSHPLIPHGLVILVGEQNTRDGCKSYKRAAKWYREKKKRGTPLHTTFYHPNGRLSPKNNCEKHNVLRSKALWHYRPTRSTRGNQRMKKGIQLLRRPTTQWLYNWIKKTSWISFFLGWFGYEIPLNICFENIQTTRFVGSQNNSSNVDTLQVSRDCTKSSEVIMWKLDLKDMRNGSRVDKEGSLYWPWDSNHH